MPQKLRLSESLQHGQLPLWNDFTGFGYPIVGESQTGVLYPPNWVLYTTLDINSAYVVSQLVHYIIAFLATWGLVRQLGMTQGAAALAAIAFVYGWLPPRICLEWAVVGAAYFAIVLWTGIAWLETGCPRSLAALSIALGLDILAGHFNLAFIAVLAVSALSGVHALRSRSVINANHTSGLRHRRAAWLMAALVGGFLIAAVQILPTWELKQASQRKTIGNAFDPAYGHLPPIYLTQLAAPWLWHGPHVETDKALEQPSPGRYPAATNKVEAHLYVGLLPLALALYGVFLGWQKRGVLPVLPWLLMGFTGILLATGWPLVILKHLPGFSFFMGPGRYGMLTAMSLAVLAAAGWDIFARRFSAKNLRWIIGTMCLFTTVDVWLVSREYTLGEGIYFGRQVFYTSLLDDVPIDFTNDSKTATRFLSDQPGTRLYAPGANIPSLMKVSALPVYLGLGPQIYFEPEQQIDFTITSPAQIDSISTRLRDWGVTHLLLQEPPASPDWPLDYIAPVSDPVVNRAMGRTAPFYLYALRAAPGRAQLSDTGSILELTSTANEVIVKYRAAAVCDLTLVDLAYPGWSASIDGEPVPMQTDTPFRVVAVPSGEHVVTWTFRPVSVRAGATISALVLVGIVTAAWITFRRRQACALPS